MTSLSNDFQRPSDAPPSYDDVIAENRLLLATLMTSSEGNHQSRNLELMRAMREEWRTDDVTTHGRRSNSDDEGSSPIQDGTSPTTTRITSNRRSRRKYFPHYTEIRCSTKEDALKVYIKFAKKNGQRKLNSKNCAVDFIRPSCVLKFTETKFWKEGHYSYKEERVTSSNANVTSQNSNNVTSSNNTSQNPPDVSMLKLDESVKIPKSEKIISCTECCGRGSVSCEECDGSGSIPCWKCQHSGLIFTANQSEICYECSGSGKESCGVCHSRTQVECTKCRGGGKLLRYQKLKAVLKWKSQVDYEFDDKIFPEKVLEGSSGKKIQLKCAKTQDDQNSSSNKIFLKQTKNLEIIPVNEVQLTMRSDPQNGQVKFWIIGKENNVFAPHISKRGRRSFCSLM